MKVRAVLDGPDSLPQNALVDCWTEMRPYLPPVDWHRGPNMIKRFRIFGIFLAAILAVSCRGLLCVAFLLSGVLTCLADSVVTFNEAMYHPPSELAAHEWVELHNQMACDVDMGGWKLRGGVEYDFSEGTVVPAGQYLVIAASPVDMGHWTGYTNALGPFTGRMGNGGEELRLLDNSGRVMDVLDYGDDGDWPVTPDGSGVTLAKIDREWDSSRPENWSRSREPGGTPGSANSLFPTPWPGPLVFSEIEAGTNVSWWLELANVGDEGIDPSGCIIAVIGDSLREQAISNTWLSAGAHLVLTEAQLGFRALPGETVVLYAPGKTNVLDARHASKRLRGVLDGDCSRWLYPEYATPGEENAFHLQRDIVVNEIMYHPRPDVDPYRESNLEWLELYNRGTSSVDLSGWSFADGIVFDFASGPVLPPDGYLVVAKNPAAMLAVYPEISDRVMGPYSGELSNGGERIVLIDARRNPADEVRYCDGGYWPSAADGQGSSSELRDPRADSGHAGAWAASDEAARAVWSNYSYRAVASSLQGEPTLWHEFAFGMLAGPAEVLLDDVSVVEDPGGAAIELIQNGGFSSGSAHWRFLGNHQRSAVVDDGGNPVLHLRSSGAMEYQGNQIETTFIGNRAIVDGREYEVSFRAKWLSGGRRINTRAFFQRLANTTNLRVPIGGGTPGLPNSCVTANWGPTYCELVHSPAVPNAGEPVVVSASMNDPDGIVAATLWYRPDGAAWASAEMTPGEDCYTGMFTAGPAGSIVQFYIEARDTLGAETMYPPGGPDSRALCKADDGAALAGALHNIRILMLQAEANYLHAPTNTLSNELLGGTLIYDEKKVFHDVGVRLKGSFVGRDVLRVGFVVAFHPDRLFRDVHRKIGIDRSTGSAYANIGTVREILVKHIACRAGGGIPGVYDDLTWVMTPRPASAANSRALLSMAAFDDVYLDSQYDKGSEGNVYEFEVYRWHGSTVDGNPESSKNPASRGNYRNVDIQDLGDSKEFYRWLLLKVNNRDRDDYDAVMAFAKGLSLEGSALDAASRRTMDMDSCMRTLAYASLVGAADTYYIGINAHNIRLYARHDNGKIRFMPWDWDSLFSNSHNAPLIGGWNIAKVVNLTGNRRSYYGHMKNIVGEAFNAGYMGGWAEHYGFLTGQDYSPQLSYINNRSEYVLSQLPADPVVFAVTNAVGIVDSDVVTIAGTGSIDFKDLYLDGVPDPLDLTWTSTGSGLAERFEWSGQAPLDPGTNRLVLEARGFGGEVLATSIVVIVSTITERPLRDGLRVTELMVDPPEGSACEFIELCNTGLDTLEVDGVSIRGAVDFAFAESSVTTLLPGRHVVVVADTDAFSARYGTNGVMLAGEYRGKLANEGERLEVCGRWGQEIIEFSYGNGRGWPLAAQGAGHSLVPTESALASEPFGSLSYGGNWRASARIGGSPGGEDIAREQTVLLNEILAHTDTNAPPYDSNDKIELFNAGVSDVSLTNWYLSDDRSILKKWAIPAGTAVSAGSQIVFDEMTGFHFPITQGFGLNKAGEELLLSYLPGTEQDCVADSIGFKGQQNDVSLGRAPDGGMYWHAMPPTLSSVNADPNAHAVINELMYHPPSTDPYGEDNAEDEYIEVFNPTDDDLPLWETAGGWRLGGGVSFTFVADTVIPARGHLVVVPFDPATNPVALARFLDVYDLVPGRVLLNGPYAGKLSNGGDRICLEKPQPADLLGDPPYWVIVDEVIYFDRTPWVREPDGQGPPLQRREPTVSGNAPHNWYPGLSATPGAAAESVAIAWPTNGASYWPPVADLVSADIDTNRVIGTVRQVEFFAGNLSLGVDTTPPYSAGLGGLTLPGTYILSAVLTDDAGQHKSRDIAIGVAATLAFWPYRMSVTVQGMNSGETLLNFPALIRLHEGLNGFGYNQFASANGNDLRFSNGGTEPFSHEIEQWNTNGVSFVWVRVPMLTNGMAITAFWGHEPAAHTPPPFATDGSVWSAEYKAVWHCHEGGEDATGQGNSATNRGASSVEGLVGGAFGFDGTGTYVATGVEPSWYGQTQSVRTLSFWARPVGDPEMDATAFGAEGSGGLLYVMMHTSLRVMKWVFGVGAAELPGMLYNAADWQMVTLILSNGVAHASLNDEVPVVLGGYAPFSLSTPPFVGGRAGGSHPFAGEIDEVRLSSVSRSPAWIRSAYRTVAAPDAFFDYGPVHCTDSDGDHLPDAWELMHFGSTAGFGNTDSDQDGSPDADEYCAGTDPTNPASVFRVFIERCSDQAHVQVPMLAPRGPGYEGALRYYDLLSASGMSQQAWSVVPGLTGIVGEDRMLTYTNPPTAPDHLFFRSDVRLTEP